MCDPIAPRLLAHRRSPTVAERQYAEWRLRAASSLRALLVRIVSRVAPRIPGGSSFKRNVASPVTGVEAVFDVQVQSGTISPHISGPRADRDTGRPLRTVPPP